MLEEGGPGLCALVGFGIQGGDGVPDAGRQKGIAAGQTLEQHGFDFCPLVRLRRADDSVDARPQGRKADALQTVCDFWAQNGRDVGILASLVRHVYTH